MLQYGVEAHRVNAHGSVAVCRSATVALDTDVRGRDDAMNPSELLLAALAASILRNLERVALQISFEFRDARVQVHASRHDAPPRLVGIEYVLTVATDESERRLALLHTNVRKQSTVYNTLLPCMPIHGTAERAAVPAATDQVASGQGSADPFARPRQALDQNTSASMSCTASSRVSSASVLRSNAWR